MFKRSQKNLVYLLILIIPFLLLFIRPTIFTPIKQIVVNVSSTPMYILNWLGLEVKKVFYYRLAYNEYIKIKKENDFLKTRLIGMESVIAENARLNKLYDFKRSLVYPSVAAHVIGRDPTYWNSSIIIDKGSRQGIRPGMPVLHTNGIVGKISEVYPLASKVIVLTDPQFSVAAVLRGSHESGLVSGTLQQNVCRMRYINDQVQVSVGEDVLTSKISSSFPENLMVGRVTQVLSNANNPSRECIIKPAVNLSQIEEVLVLIK